MLAVCGCNQIYSLDETQVRDAGAPPSDRVVNLALLVGGGTGGTEAPLTFLPLPDARPKLGLLDEPLRDVTYTPATTGGTVAYPFEFGEKRWRFEYNPPFDVAHELQWDPSAGVGFVAIPVAGRVERTVVPAGTGFALTMSVGGAPYTFSPLAKIYTTNYWSETSLAATSVEPVVTFADAKPLEGSVGSIGSTAAGDVVVAVDYELDANDCLRAKISGGAVAPAPTAGILTSIALTPQLGSTTPSLAYLGAKPLDAIDRLQSASNSNGAPIARQRFGRIAHGALPAFTTSWSDAPSPPMIASSDCPLELSPTSSTNALDSLGTTFAYHGVIAYDRTVEGVRLRSSIAFIGRFIGAVYLATLEVPLAIDVQLDGAPLPATLPADPSRLSFAFDSAYLADYYEVTLYRLAAGALVPVRVYVGLDVTAARPTIQIDPSIVTAGATHVFAIRTYRGRPRAPIGDFRTVDYFQAAGTVFTSTFTR